MATLNTISGKHQQLTAILTQVKQQFKQVYQQDLIDLVLFGSQARGEAKPDSDIDILVILKDKMTQDKRYDLI